MGGWIKLKSAFLNKLNSFNGYKSEKNNVNGFCPHRLNTDADEQYVLQGKVHLNVTASYFINLHKPNI